MGDYVSVSLLFPAFNRLAFTRQAWAALIANTDWSLVNHLYLYDDGSTDGTCEWLYAEYERLCAAKIRPTHCGFHQTKFHSPMGVTLDWIRQTSNCGERILAKLDNDTIYPPGWLNIALDVMARHPELDTLGLECMRKPAKLLRGLQPDGRLPIYSDAPAQQFGYLPAVYISGLGLYRRSIFCDSLPKDGGYFGFEDWMQANCKSGWILPSLPTILLDRLPMDPWKSLSEEYVRKGWQRPWSGAGPLRYKPEQHEIWDWWQPA